jgi:hypothetical protein
LLAHIGVALNTRIIHSGGAITGQCWSLLVVVLFWRTAMAIVCSGGSASFVATIT